MSGFQDVRDVMEISSAPDGVPRPLKKQRTVERRPDGITRELFALLGENPPPVAIVESKFKEKPRWMGKANPWVWKGFTNPARCDSLALNHWERKTELESDTAYRFSQFDVKLDIPEYSDGEYELLKDDDWSREETDYLFQLCREFDLRFTVIWDRYDFPEGVPRTLEDIKARYYSVCRSLMELRTPVSQMTPEETVAFNLMKFDKEREVARRQMLERQFERSSEECREEEVLIGELKRILINQEKMAEERRDLYQRLSFPTSNGTISAYTGSQGLAHLREMMASSSDRSKKRKSLAATQMAGDGSGPASVQTPDRPLGMFPLREGQLARKQVRRLSTEEEQVYGVSSHERLASGVKLRSSMITTNFKGASAQKIAQALTQLNISSRLTMPTVRTSRKFEELQASVGALIDAKKLLDKVDQEVRVLKSQRGSDA